jgi:hypothetical protein
VSERGHSSRRDGSARAADRAPAAAPVDSRHARAEQLRCLARREPSHVAQDQRRPLPRRQVLDRRHERDLERLAGDRRLVRVHQSSGIWLEPQHVGGDRRDVTLGIGRGRATSTGSTRGPRRATWSGQAFVAMRYSQARNDHRRSRLNRARARQARANVSCIRSSESSNDPTMR